MRCGLSSSGSRDASWVSPNTGSVAVLPPGLCFYRTSWPGAPWYLNVERLCLLGS